MFEWQNIPKAKFVNPRGVETYVQLQYKFPTVANFDEVDRNGRDIDHVAYDHIGSEKDAITIVGMNAQRLVEYDFDISTMERVKVPR